MNIFTVVFLIALAISYTIQFWLNKRQIAYVTEHRSEVPAAFESKVSLAAHQKAADYTVEKNQLATIDGIIGIVALILLTLGGVINWVFNAWAAIVSSPLWAGVAAVASIFILMTLIELDWINKSAAILTCSACGQIQWFSAQPARET